MTKPISECGGRGTWFGPAVYSAFDDPFFNANTPDDWALAQRYLSDAEK